MYTIYSAYAFDDHIEIKYTVKLPGNVITEHKDFLYNTNRIGNWDCLIFCYGMSYIDFLHNMVVNNIDICRKLVRMELNTVLNQIRPSETKTFIKLMNAICILDSTFKPPYINIYSDWQKQLLRDICNSTSFHIIALCKNRDKLNIYFNVLKTLS